MGVDMFVWFLPLSPYSVPVRGKGGLGRFKLYGISPVEECVSLFLPFLVSGREGIAACVPAALFCCATPLPSEGGQLYYLLCFHGEQTNTIGMCMLVILICVTIPLFNRHACSLLYGSCGET